MNVLALASYPLEAAATRYRVVQFVGPLAERGIRVEVRPFMDGELFKAFYRPGGAGASAARLALSTLCLWDQMIKKSFAVSARPFFSKAICTASLFPVPSAS